MENDKLNQALKLIGATVTEYKALQVITPQLLSSLSSFMEEHRQPNTTPPVETNPLVAELAFGIAEFFTDVLKDWKENKMVAICSNIEPWKSLVFNIREGHSVTTIMAPFVTNTFFSYESLNIFTVECVTALVGDKEDTPSTMFHDLFNRRFGHLI